MGFCPLIFIGGTYFYVKGSSFSIADEPTSRGEVSRRSVQRRRRVFEKNWTQDKKWSFSVTQKAAIKNALAKINRSLKKITATFKIVAVVDNK